ncbi:MAG: type I polyketide synthase [Acidobacteriota bacterium]|nr:type I polyketide synthase [Acidobacteriota bacterium]
MSNTHHPGSPDGPPREEPVAIVGMACRFPGSKDLAGYWRQLLAAENAVVEGPPGSVIGRPGRQFPQFAASNEAIRFGAYVEDLDLFDAEFFRISPIEAQMLDPQQRMMLEVSWWALEDAAIDPGSLKGSRTGVYAGISIMDYRDMAISDPGTSEAAAGLYAATGNALNTAIGRVSFVLGLEGPSMAIDTACSSSLVAIHQAVAGLQRGEADLVLAGGVHAQFAGRPLELRANAGMLSPTGQCWTFDAAADGFVSGEGCGLIVLKRLSDAQTDGDRIWAVIPGSAVNQDGASQGLTVPSAPSQEKAMEAALARAGASPSDVDYLETHGTGTIVGDPIELNAAAAVYGRERDAEHPLLVGSVKTNIGHLGPAAGVAGLIKAVLAMRHGVIPRHLNFSNPNPNIDWDRLPVRVTDGMTDWPLHPDRPRLAGVNSFGWSGTNGHVLVQGYDELEAPAGAARASFPASVRLPVKARTVPGEEPLGEPGTRETRFLPLSARSPEALREVAGRYLSWLDEETDPDLSDLAWTAAVGRSHFAHRAGLVFSEAAQLRQQLEDLAAGEGGGTPRAAQKVAFVFTGQASQWPGMGRALYEREPVFRSVLDRCDRLLSEDREVSLLDVMFGENGTDGLLDEPTWTQPAIYSLECALVALWESLGVRPSVVVGHSLGEIAAARAAGGFTLEQGLRYASARGTLMGATRSDGAMAAVFAPRPASPKRWRTTTPARTTRTSRSPSTTERSRW